MNAFVVHSLPRQQTPRVSRTRPYPICTQNNTRRAAAASTLAVAAAAAVALPFVPSVRVRMTHAQRTTVQTGGVLLAVGSLALRVVPHRRAQRRLRDGLLSNPIGSGDFLDASDELSEEEDENDKPNTHGPTKSAPNSSLSAVFSSSRAEWANDSHESGTQASVDVNVSPQEGSDIFSPKHNPTVSSTMYSYSFRSSGKKSHSGTEAVGRKTKENSDNTKSPFSQMREEFAFYTDVQTTNVGNQENNVASADKDAWPRRNSRDLRETEAQRSSNNQRQRRRQTRRERKSTLQPLSGVQIARRLAGLPVFIMREVVVPITEVVSVVWFDLRAYVVDWAEEKSGYLIGHGDLEDWDKQEDMTWANEMEKLANSGPSDQDDGWLSEEERQIRQVERAADKAVNTVQSTFKQFARIFLK